MGQFSWFTQDNHSRIINDKKEDVYMVDPRNGIKYKESCYKGYGIFGGRDFYELFADINKNIILKYHVHNYKNYDRNIVRILITADYLNSKLSLFKGKTLDEIKLMVMDSEYKDTHPGFDDIPVESVENFDIWYQQRIDQEIDSVIKEDERYFNLYSKPFYDLTEKDIDDKRQDGIELWFSVVEPQMNKYLCDIEDLHFPILVRNPNSWKMYKDSYPETDPDQGWEV